MASPLSLLKLTVLLVFFFSISLHFASAAVGAGESSPKKKMAVGSKPPECRNKCLGCRPCMATLVESDHGEMKSFEALSRDDDTYYLLRWTCQCGNKLYKP